MSRRNSALWAAGIAICSLAALESAGWTLYKSTERLSEQDLDSRLRALAKWTALLVGPERAEALVSGEGWAAEEIAPTLKAALEEGNLDNIYFFGPDLELRYDIRGYYRLSGGSFPPFALGPLLRAAAGQASSSQLYRVGGSYLKSAYAPVRDEEGYVVAVVGVEGSAKYFSTLSQIRRYFVTFGLFGLLLASAVAYLAYRALSWLSSAEQALAKAETSEAMGRMAAQMAHEIRNPLSIVRAAAVRLRSKYGGSVDPKLIDFILEEVERIKELTDHYLSLSREETINPEPCDLVVLVKDVVEVLDGHPVEVDLPPKPVVVHVDPNRIRQVLLNLISNAEEAVSEVPDPRIRIFLRTSRKGAYISVEDNGRGVPREFVDKIFHPFFTTKEKGSGLGLYIVRRIVEAHGGEVHLRSRPGRTSFVVFLPWKPNIR